MASFTNLKHRVAGSDRVAPRHLNGSLGITPFSPRDLAILPPPPPSSLDDPSTRSSSGEFLRSICVHFVLVDPGLRINNEFDRYAAQRLILSWLFFEIEESRRDIHRLAPRAPDMSALSSSRSRPKRARLTQPAPEVPPPIVPGRPTWLPDHPWLTFPALPDTLTIEQVYERLSPLGDRVFAGITTLYSAVEGIDTLLGHIRGHTERDLRTPEADAQYTDRSFGSLIRASVPTYPVLGYEFLGTLRVRFAVAMGIYTQAEIEEPEFVFRLCTGLIGIILYFAAAQFWPIVGSGALPREMRVSSLRDPRHRFLQKLITSFLQHR
ncbi:hypothetical protein LXL04_007402 [Taraxacum kok-saghyz]